MYMYMYVYIYQGQLPLWQGQLLGRLLRPKSARGKVSGIHYRGVQWEGGAVNEGSII